MLSFPPQDTAGYWARGGARPWPLGSTMGPLSLDPGTLHALLQERMADSRVKLPADVRRGEDLCCMWRKSIGGSVLTVEPVRTLTPT